ncbi:cytochrome c biogenesis protein ResB [Luedemannella helvata]|uniref:Cytochrome c biogenesis protein ResB n=1 Tax=Luedemannella helvata TaxID=349315 RepID=A0ABN2L5B1_9ACTN
MIASARAFWRWLTSMRTALLLLFLLAVAAIPGSLLPQRNLNPERVNQYLRDHPDLGPWLDRLWGFSVYSSPWFSAIYLLLFTSLVGCLLPRLAQHVRALRAVPPDAPKRLDRLPQHASGLAADGAPAAVAEAVAATLRKRRWRVAVREHADGVTVAAEKGYLKETGNLLFHFSLLALLVGVAAGSWYGWEGNRIVVAGPDHGFCSSIPQFDESALGARVGAEDLPPFCLQLDGFDVEYLDSGQPVSFAAHATYTEGLSGAPRQATFSVNDPLRLDGANVYLFGHGYAVIVRYTDRYGVSQTTVAPFLVDDDFLTSHGLAAFPDANIDPTGKAPRSDRAQTAFSCVYLPTVPSDVTLARSAHPAEKNPALMCSAYQGDIGLDTGRAQSVYELDRRQIDSGQLSQVGPETKLAPGESWTLPDGSTMTFLGTRKWAALSVRYDPGQQTVLAGSVVMLAGLLISLTGRRRRAWARVVPDEDGRSLISLGGLPRTEQPSFAVEFSQLVSVIEENHGRTVRPAADVDDPGVRPGNAGVRG